MIRDLVEENLSKEQRDERVARRMIAEYQLHQAKAPSREWDINDPKAISKEKLSTGSRLEAEGAAGPASMLVFQGEDRNYGDRRRLMQAQLRNWTDQQKQQYV